MKKIQIAGVPEHFSAPWKYAIEHNLFANAGINIEFIEYGTGTGAMCKDLTAGIIDMAVLLTEGIIKYQQTDPSIKIISQFVDTPLNWGIHVHKNSSFQTLADLKHARFGISRFGSGSHLMVKVLAKQQHWDFTKINFIELGPIESLSKSILDKTSDVFLWEVLTTKAFHKDFQLRLLNILQSPWPCFQIAVTNNFSQQAEILQKILSIIFEVCRQFNADHNLAADNIEKFYHLSRMDILQWLKTVRWSEKIIIDDKIVHYITVAAP